MWARISQAAIDFVAALGESFIPDIHNAVINAADQVAFNCDNIGRKRQIAMILRQAQKQYGDTSPQPRNTVTRM
jgi:hypothetical protein